MTPNLNVTFDDIDWFIRRSTEGPDNPFTIIIGFFFSVYAAAGVVLVCAGLYGMLTRKGNNHEDQ